MSSAAKLIAKLTAKLNAKIAKRTATPAPLPAPTPATLPEPKPTCYICLDEETTRRPFLATSCTCKGSMGVHRRCFQKMIATTPTLVCPTCKESFSGLFLQQFMSPEDIFCFGEEEEEEDEEYEFVYSENGIEFQIKNEQYIFESITQMDFFFEMRKKAYDLFKNQEKVRHHSVKNSRKSNGTSRPFTLFRRLQSKW